MRIGSETARRVTVESGDVSARILGLFAHPAFQRSLGLKVFCGDGSRHDRAAYFSAARERISTLEELMLTELTAEGEERDAGWDTESLREEFGKP